MIRNALTTGKINREHLNARKELKRLTDFENANNKQEGSYPGFVSNRILQLNSISMDSRIERCHRKNSAIRTGSEPDREWLKRSATVLEFAR